MRDAFVHHLLEQVLALVLDMRIAFLLFIFLLHSSLLIIIFFMNSFFWIKKSAAPRMTKTTPTLSKMLGHQMCGQGGCWSRRRPGVGMMSRMSSLDSAVEQPEDHANLSRFLPSRYKVLALKKVFLKPFTGFSLSNFGFITSGANSALTWTKVRPRLGNHESGQQRCRQEHEFRPGITQAAQHGVNRHVPRSEQPG